MHKLQKSLGDISNTGWIGLVFLCLLSFYGYSYASDDTLNRFKSLVEKDDGLSQTQKEEWISLALNKFQGKTFSFDYSRLLYAVLSQAMFDEVDIIKASQVALDCVMAVELGGPEDEVFELVVFAFSEELSPEEICRYADLSKRCKAAGVAIPVTQEMIRNAKKENWPESTFTPIMEGLMEAAGYNFDTEKVALFMLISVVQNLGSPEQIVKDAIEDAKKREPEKWKKEQPELKTAAVENSALIPPRVALDFDSFKNSVTSFLGTAYLWGGNTRRGVDCSGFTKLVMEENGYRIPRVSRDQAKIGEPVDKSEFKLGDLVFFDIKRAGKITHVGLYLGGNLLAHASSSKGVTIVYFSNRYFQSRFVCGRRIVQYR